MTNMLIGEFTSLNPSHIRRITTKIDHHEVPYFLVHYSNGDREWFASREVYVKDISGCVDSSLCIAILNHYFN